MEMDELLACRVCLATDNVKLYNFHKYQLTQAYEILTGIQIVDTDGLPQHICSFCGMLLLKCVAFKEKCCNSHDLLKYCLSQQSELSISYIRSLNTEIHDFVPPYTIVNNLPVISCQHEDIEIKEEEIEQTVFSNDALGEHTVFSDGVEINFIDIKYEDETEKPKMKKNKKSKSKKSNFITYKSETVHKLDEPVEIDMNVDHTVEIGRDGNKVDHDLSNNFAFNQIEGCFDDDIANEIVIDEAETAVEDTELIDVEIVNLTKQQQLDEIKARKNSFNYTNSAFKCNKCYKGFITESTYKNHMQRHDPKNGAYECDICFTRTDEARSLKAHIINSHKRKFICKLCDYVSRSTHRAREHSKWHKGYSFICKICGATFAKSTSHLTHIRLQHPSNNACDICGESFIGEYGLRMHKKRAHKRVSVETFVCMQCSVEFQNLEALNRHLESGNGLCVSELRFCPHCGEGFSTEDDLSDHLKEHQTPVVKNVVVHCDECKRTFASEKSYSIHYQRFHLGVKLKQHKPCFKRPPESVVCEICGKRCISKATLKYHHRIHTGETPYHCTECPKKFGVYQRLQIHLRTHTGESPYKCKHCPKAFKHKAALNRHDRVHTGVKPYMCPHCGKTFSQSNSMKLHVNTVHLKMPAPYKTRRNKN